MTSPDLISSKEVEFEKMLLINVEVLEILVGRSIWGNKKLELSVSIKLLIESESSYFNKSILKSPNKKIILKDSFCSFKGLRSAERLETVIICLVFYIYFPQRSFSLPMSHHIEFNPFLAIFSILETPLKTPENPLVF